MKYCPNCRSSYADDTLKFCLQDGIPLVGNINASTELPTLFGDKTEQFSGSEVTEQFRTNEPTTRFTTNKDVGQMRIDVPETRPNTWEQSRETLEIASVQPKPQKSNTLIAVLATALVMLILFGIAGIGAWFYFAKPENEVVKNTNNQSTSENKSSPKDNSSKESPTPTTKPTSNPKETPAVNFDPEEVKKEVSDVIYSWKSASESLNLDAHLSKYAETVDYYNKSKVGKNVVRNDKQKAYTKYHNIEINLSNMSVTLDAKGKNATAVFDKAWFFEGNEKNSEGKVQSRLKLAKIGEEWKITGEKDLKVYFVK